MHRALNPEQGIRKSGCMMFTLTNTIPFPPSVIPWFWWTASVTCMTLVWVAPLPADDSSDQTESFEKSLDALSLVFDELDQHAKKLDELKQRQTKINTAFQATEKAVAQIQTQGFQKQLQAMNSARTSDQIFRELQQERNPNDPGNGGGVRDRNTEAFLSRQKAAADFDVMLKSNEILQLSAELQNALRRRVDACKDMLQLESEYFEWQTLGNQKQAKLSEFLDFDGSRSKGHNQAMLELVQKRGTNYAASKFLEGLLNLRLSLNAEASKCFEQSEELNPALSSVAKAGKAVVALQREDKKKGKPEMAQAVKLDKTNPVVLGLRALWSGEQKEYAMAGKDLDAIAKKSDFELPATRLAVLITASKTKVTPREAKEMLENAELALKLSGPEDWLSQLVLAIALKENDRKEDALSAAQLALELARGSNRDRCTEVIQAIEESKPIVWALIAQP
jgi:tetratricopeptide (TPR) repeat protein